MMCTSEESGLYASKSVVQMYVINFVYFIHSHKNLPGVIRCGYLFSFNLYIRVESDSRNDISNYRSITLTPYYY
jgi:hypothetical protein